MTEIDQEDPTSDVRYPEITVSLEDADAVDLDEQGVDQAGGVLGTVAQALREGGVDEAEISAFYAEATDGDYDLLLEVVRGWVTVE